MTMRCARASSPRWNASCSRGSGSGHRPRRKARSSLSSKAGTIRDGVTHQSAIDRRLITGGDGGRIGGVAFEYLHRRGATVRGAQQADHQLWPVTPTGAAGTAASQDTAAPFQVGGGDVVEHQCAVLEMAAGELVFDAGLLAAEPVEGGVDLAGGDAAEAKGFTQRVAGGGTVEHPRRCEFRRRIE